MGLSPDMFCGDLPWPTEGETTLQAWLEAHTEPAGAGSKAPLDASKEKAGSMR